MIRLEHLNLVVKDLASTLTFYQAAFPHWRVRQQGEQNWYGTQMRWLHFGDDYNYLTFNDNGSGTNRDLKGNSLGLAHFGLEVTNLEAMLARLHRAGFEPVSQGGASPNRNNAYFIDPNGFEVEFVEYLSDLPELRNSSEEK